MGDPIRCDYSVVIPVYGGEPFLERLHQRLTAVFKNIPGTYEIIMVDDRSPDGSWEVMKRIRAGNPAVKLVQLSRNFGQHNATICGFAYCSGRYVITMDDDLQHPPEEIPKLIDEIKKGYAIVYGKYRRKRHGWFRSLGSHLTNKVLRRITDCKFDLTSFRIIRADVLRHIEDLKIPNGILDLMVFQVVAASEISYCSVEHDENKDSRYGFFKLLSIASNLVLNYTVAPLRLAAVLGLVFSAVSFALSCMFLVLYLANYTTVSGFTSIVLLISFLSGILLFVLGIIGEYIGRMFVTLNHQPIYIVKQTDL